MEAFKSIFKYNSSKDRLWQANAAFAQSIPADSYVLDAGAGEEPYKPLFAHCHYESADFLQVDKPYTTVTYICDLKDIPVEEERFDYVVFNQVMEHLPDPKAVLRELNRVLKPGGKMIYSAPLFFEEHEQPYDFFRYTQYGVRELFTVTGFEIENLDWLEGYYGTVGYQLLGMARYLPLHPREYGGGITGVMLAALMLPLRLLFGFSSALFYRMDKHYKYTKTGYPKNYVAIALKKL